MEGDRGCECHGRGELGRRELYSACGDGGQGTWKRKQSGHRTRPGKREEVAAGHKEATVYVQNPRDWDSE